MDQLNRRISVIVYADIVGYSSMMQKDESEALLKLRHFEEVIESFSKKYEGEVVKAYGDGCLMLFPSALNAVKCAVEIQKALGEEPAVPLRIGIHIGEIVRKGHDVFGDGVNITSRIESMGVANSILVSAEIYFQIKNRPEIHTIKLGAFDFKNIERDIVLYAISNDGLAVPEGKEMQGKGKAKSPGPDHVSKQKVRPFRIALFAVLLAGALYASYQLWPAIFSDAENQHRGLIFATKVEANGQAIDPNNTFPQNITDFYAVFRSNMAPPGMKINVEEPVDGAYYAYLKVVDGSSISKFGWRWYREGQRVLEFEMDVKSGEGVWLQRYNYSGDGVFSGDFSPGRYTIVILIDGNPATSAELIITPSKMEESVDEVVQLIYQ